MSDCKNDEDLENIPGIFIIESFSFKEEQNNDLPGYHLYQSLTFCKINEHAPLYYFIRTKREFEEVLNKFEESNYEFLHLFCHGNSTHLELALEQISFEDFFSITEDRLYRKRLFISACNVVNIDFAKLFIPRVHCKSIIGAPAITNKDIEFLVWSSFYYQMLVSGNTFMKQKSIIEKIKDLTRLYGIEMIYYSIINDNHSQSAKSLNMITINRGEKVNIILETPFKNKYRDISL